MLQRGRFQFVCPICGVQAASAWRVLSLGPASSFPCPGCHSRLGIQRGLATASVVIDAVAFPAGAVATVVAIGSFSRFGFMTLAFVLGGIAACLPSALWVLLSAKLIAREEPRQSNAQNLCGDTSRD